MRSAQILALAMAVATSEAVSQGFNYGNKKGDGSVKNQADFETEFTTAKNLVGTDHAFTSARLYTMIQDGTTNGPIEAIPAAIKEKTSLLLGLWASGGGMDNEIAALKSAIETYGDDFTDLVVGISVGSEDLYRNSEIGMKANAGVGVDPDELVDYINRVRSTISGTSLSGAPIGHVDTWNTWTNGSNSAVVDAVDWLGFDGYPYFENTKPNSIDDAKDLFEDGVAKTKAIAGDKEVWITETGWPVTGDTENLAVANKANAEQYWKEVACPLLGNTNTWWYILEEASSTPNFGVTDAADNIHPMYDLSCKASSSSSSAAASTSTPAVAQKSGFVSSAAPSATGAAGSGSGSGATGSGSGSGATGSGSTGSGATGSGSTGSGSTGSTGSGSGSVGSGSTGSGSGSAASSANGFPAPSSTAMIGGTRPSTKPKSKSPSASATAVATKTSGSSATATGSNGSGSSSNSGSGSGSGSAASPSSTVAFSSATRVAGSAAGALIAALAVAFTF